MKVNYGSFLNRYLPGLIVFLSLMLSVFTGGLRAQCGPSTPSFTANLVGAPNGTIIVPNVARDDTCCGAMAPDKCIKITILLDVGAMGINFQVYGAVPPGALFYQIGCGPQIAVGTPICLNGQGPHILTFCKPGNNINSYGIISIPAPVVPDSILVRNGCSATLAVSGFSVPTITWNSIYPGASGAYNSYLSCTSGCATVTATPSGTPPPYVDYLVGGYAEAPCQSNFYQDTVRVYYYQDLLANITPSNPTICFGSSTAVLTASVTGGLSPYTYTWSNASTSTSVSVGPGVYTVNVGDATGCPPTTATAIVNQFTLPITANPGPATTICKSSPTVALSGTIGMASGGIWSGGTGSFSPSSTLLTTSYIPTSAELNAGSVQLFLNSTGNQGCPPGSGTITLTFQDPPLVNAGTDKTVCANNSLVSLTGGVTGFSSTVIWSSLGSGTFASTTNTTTSYSPGTGDILTGSVNIVLTSTNNGACPPATDTVKVLITPGPTVNAGPDQLICSNSSAVLSGTIGGPTNTGSWTTSGDGSFSPATSVLNPSYTPGPIDINTGTVSLILSSTNNGSCLVVKDTLKLTIRKLAIVNAGINQALCSVTSTVALSGSIGGGTNTGIWASGGTGNFVSATSSLTTTYSFSTADALNGFVIFTLSSTNNGPCPVISDTVKIGIRQLATVNAGLNQAICSSQNTISLSGAVTGSTSTGTWFASGAGSFIPGSSTLLTSYSITTADANSGFVTFTLTSTNNGVCPAVSDTVRVRIAKLAVVNAGTNQNVCSNAASISLAGIISGGVNSGTWGSNGPGSFSPGTSSLNTSYSLSPTDITNGSVTFTLTSSSNTPCPLVSDTVMVRISLIASVNSGSNQSVCSSQNGISLSGLVSGAAGTGSWSASGAGAYSPGASNLTTSYSLTPQDITTGFVTFTLTSTNNGVCPVIKDTVRMKIVKLPAVFAGASQSICSTQGSVALTGTVTGGNSTGAWTTSGTGTFNPSANLPATNYYFSPGDIVNGTILLILESTNNGPCPSVEDSLYIYVKNPAQVNAGPSQTICSITNTVNLSGTIFGNFGGLWTSSGGGSFGPDNTALNTIYSLTSLEQSGTNVSFTLSSTNNGGCPVVSSVVNISVTRLASVNAGIDKAVCSSQLNVNVNGVITGGTSSGQWTSSGTGIFSSASNPVTIYNASNDDVVQGTVWLVLYSTNNGVCPAVSDSLKLSIVKNPTVILNLDTIICEKQYPFRIDAQHSGGSGMIHWTTSGTGSITPVDAIPAYYYFTSEDVSTRTVVITLSSVNNGPCGDVSGSTKLVLLPSAKASFELSASTISLPSDPVLFTNQTKDADIYFWSFGDGGSSKLKNPTYVYNNVGYFTITLIANNEYNCSDTAQKIITVIRDVQFPTAFTPNSAGSNGGAYNVKDYSNDVFFPYTGGVVEYDLAIFNRWGEVIFRTNNIETGWDGYFKGKLCQQDAYVWKANIKFFDGRTYNKTGSVTLLR